MHPTKDYISPKEPHFRLVDVDGRIRGYAYHKTDFGHIPAELHVIEYLPKDWENDDVEE